MMPMNKPEYDVLQALGDALKGSELIRLVKKAKAAYALLSQGPTALRKAGYKPLSKTQIRTLEKQGNTADHWKDVWVTAGFDPKRVQRCHFAGPVLLGSFSGFVEVEGIRLPSGISHSFLSSCVIGSNAFIRNVRLLNRTVVLDQAILFDVGTLTKGQSDSFANGKELALAIETGGREVAIYAELTVEGAWVLARSRGNRKLLSDYAERLAAYVKEASAPCNVIGPQARILNTPWAVDLFLGDSAVIRSATQVENVAVLSSASEPSEISHGAIVRSSILQWGCEVTTGAIVDTSLLTEHSHVERHGKVTHSLLGPNTGVAEGEVTSALVGPFVGFHHQALLIAALWPEGKGNVGYGANIGSNHTAKAPDQEIWPGEGTFFGLGVNVKFPTDLTRSPYTIIASGVSMLPQKVEFPFSLINTPAHVHPGISPAYNEIMPGWVLSDNIYMVKRNEGKYAKRNKAKRSKFVFEVFRPEIVDMMVEARDRLKSVSGKEIYTAKEIEGLGKNYMTEASRKKAIETYTFYIRYYALQGLKRELSSWLASGRAEDVAQWLVTPSTHPRWEHERQILLKEFPGVEVKELLQQLVRAQERIASDVQTSKEKDDRRGAEVIEDYLEAHKPAKEDSFVKETWALTNTLKEEVQQLLSSLESLPVSSHSAD
jgi:hypothetical protein